MVPQLDNEDLEQIDTDDLEETRSQMAVAHATMRGEGFHAVLPPYTGNYMPSRPDVSFDGFDDSVYKTKDTDIDNDSVFRPKTDQTKPKFTKINFVKSDENVKSVNKENTHKQVECPRKSQSPRAVVTKSEQVLVNTAKQSSLRASASIKGLLIKKSAAKTNNLNEKVKTARVNNVTTAGPKAVVSAAVGNGKNVVKSSACWIWRPTGNVIDHTSKDSGSYMSKRFDYVDL
ncbi:hypothetical protein Tco_1123248 [Tanacetum coccineum]|uniref:Uncharacterized protein n=1 Tax=Tanacetum coccineum TaxID=301880 RepID=A0ABQ5J2T6_9ASTR